MTKAIEEVYSSLKGQFRGDLIRPGDDEYETARGIWNAMVARRLLSKRTRKCSTRCLTEPTLLEIARYPVSWLWLADYTLDGCDRPLVDASARPNSPKRPAGNDVIIWSLSLRLFLSSSSSSLETTRPNNRSIFFKVAWCMASSKVAFRSLEQWARQHHDIK